MIFAAGYGTRLKPWTDSHPKALVPVGGVPALARVIERLRGAGVSRVIVNTHHFADQIHDFVERGGYGAFVAISHEPVILDTGGGLRKALPLIGDEPVLVHNADIMTDLPLPEMAAAHRASGADATLLTDVRRTSRFLLFGRDDRLCGYYRAEGEKILPSEIPASALPAGAEGRCFDGVHIVSPRLYGPLRDYAPDGQPFSIIDFYRASAPGYAIVRHDLPHGCSWFDVGNPATLEAANQHYTSLQ